MNVLGAIGFERPDWWAQAACRTLDPNVMFPVDGVGVERARRICARCDVREECLAGALERRETDGVWGGTSERQRRRLMRLSGIRRPRPTQQPHDPEERTAS